MFRRRYETIAALALAVGASAFLVLPGPGTAQAAPTATLGASHAPYVPPSSSRWGGQPWTQHRPIVPSRTATPTPTPTRSPTPTPTPSPTPSPSGYTVRADWAASVLTRLNQQRTANGRPAVTSNSQLIAAAHGHNLAMAQANVLSHQLSGEPDVGVRIRNAGYTWSTCGENIAYNGRRSEAGVLELEDLMYGETPPNDGHRLNILNADFTDVGIDVIDDAVHGKVWLVTDFGAPRFTGA